MNKRVFSEEQIIEFLHEVPDPEIPVIDVVELGIVREVFYRDDLLIVTITPTYSGCPATDVIKKDVEDKLREKGVPSFSVVTVMSPAWTTDWIGEEAKEKLRAYGIVPPEHSSDKGALLGKNPAKCPRCSSENTELVSQFGSTPCKSLYKCRECLEPFDLFKCI